MGERCGRSRAVRKMFTATADISFEGIQRDRDGETAEKERGEMESKRQKIRKQRDLKVNGRERCRTPSIVHRVGGGVDWSDGGSMPSHTAPWVKAP